LVTVFEFLVNPHNAGAVSRVLRVKRVEREGGVRAMVALTEESGRREVSAKVAFAAALLPLVLIAAVLLVVLG
jgi:hypothetical protein